MRLKSKNNFFLRKKKKYINRYSFCIFTCKKNQGRIYIRSWKNVMNEMSTILTDFIIARHIKKGGFKI